jgi:hypothetical protein
MNAQGELEVPKESKKEERDRDGLHKRGPEDGKQYWHFRLVVDGHIRSFSTKTTDFQKSSKNLFCGTKRLEKRAVTVRSS